MDGAPSHPPTNGKLERFPDTLKTRITLLVDPSLEHCYRVMAAFIHLSNTRGDHEGIGNVTPLDG